MNKKYADKIDSIMLKIIELEELKRASNVELNTLIDKIEPLEKRRIELLTTINRIPLDIQWLKSNAINLQRRNNERN